MEATYYVKVDENNCAYFDQVEKLNNYGAHNRDTISRLLWAFFHYWAYEHDYTRDVISIRTGRIIRYDIYLAEASFFSEGSRYVMIISFSWSVCEYDDG